MLDFKVELLESVHEAQQSRRGLLGPEPREGSVVGPDQELGRQQVRPPDVHGPHEGEHLQLVDRVPQLRLLEYP